MGLCPAASWGYIDAVAYPHLGGVSWMPRATPVTEDRGRMGLLGKGMSRARGRDGVKGLGSTIGIALLRLRELPAARARA